VVCKKDVGEEEKALECDLCDQWEHVSCIRVTDRSDETMYQALMESTSKANLYVSSQCQKRGSVAKRLCKYELESEHACKEPLASVHMLDEAYEQLQRAEVHYKEERSHMQQEITKLHELLRTLGTTVKAESWQLCEEVTHSAVDTSRSTVSESGSDDELSTCTVFKHRLHSRTSVAI